MFGKPKLKILKLLKTIIMETEAFASMEKCSLLQNQMLDFP